jgi:hypothetical protein
MCLFASHTAEFPTEEVPCDSKPTQAQPTFQERMATELRPNRPLPDGIFFILRFPFRRCIFCTFRKIAGAHMSKSKTHVTQELQDWINSSDISSTKTLLLRVPAAGYVVELSPPTPGQIPRLKAITTPSDAQLADNLSSVVAAQQLLESIGFPDPTFIASANVFVVQVTPDKAKQIIDSGLFTDITESGVIKALREARGGQARD